LHALLLIGDLRRLAILSAHVNISTAIGYAKRLPRTTRRGRSPHMQEDSIDPEKRVTAWRALREARQDMEGMIDDAVRMNDTRPMYDKLKKWLLVITAAEKDVGNLIGDLEPLPHVMEIRQIVAKLRQLGQRKTDEIASKLERADGMLMDD
jgi:hypothetical protein